MTLITETTKSILKTKINLMKNAMIYENGETEFDKNVMIYENEKTLFDENAKTYESDKNINILSVININVQKIKYTKQKKQFCLFCNKQVNRFGRHLLSVHKHEDVLTIIISYKKNYTKNETYR